MSVDVAALCERILREFIADPARNNLGPGRPDPAWEGFLLGFAAGDDPLWEELKAVVGPEHWTPAEALAAGRDAAAGSVGARSPKQPTNAKAASPGPDASSADAARPVVVAPRDLTVVSWAVIQTEATKAANRRETRAPSEAWARARVFGQQANRELHLTLLHALRAAGHEAIAPALVPAWGEVDQGTNGWHSTWSERHVAYVSGLGAFGLSGGLITRRGQAVRFGSVVVKAVIAATPRRYASPFAYCLELSGPGCAECAERCPVGSVSVQGRDKVACVRHLDRLEAYVKEHYGFDGYGCGLCQTGVPCESAIPEELRPADGA
jgi:epoxyqueuosine reductase